MNVHRLLLTRLLSLSRLSLNLQVLSSWVLFPMTFNLKAPLVRCWERPEMVPVSELFPALFAGL